MSTIEKLESTMRQFSLCIRAIPLKTTRILEASHIIEFPNGKVVKLPEFNREMLVVESIPENAGKFIVEQQMNTDKTTRFHPSKYYNSLEQVLADWQPEEHPAEDDTTSTNHDFIIAAEGNPEKGLPSIVYWVCSQSEMNVEVYNLEQKGYDVDGIHVFPSNAEIKS